MPNRDTYFFDLCNEACLDPTEQADWVNIGILFSDERIEERNE